MLPGNPPPPDRQQTTNTHTDTPSNTGNAAASPPTLALPKGGGAIRGIGEKFAANPVTGTGSMSVPIATSPGRAGFGPQLSLSYDSGAGNGPFGFGWSLSLPSITRKTDKGLPQYFDAEESDVFILSGAEDLVPVYRQDPDGTWVASHLGFRRDANGFWVRDPSGRLVVHEDELDGYRIRRYRPRIEGLFARIERWAKLGVPGDVHWRSISKDNILTLYGFDANSRITDPLDATHIFSWLICETRDDKGNAVLYRYKAEDGLGADLGNAHERNRGPQNDARRTANRYLKRIHYGNRTPLLDNAGHRPRFLDKPQIDTQIDNADWMFEVVFDYDDHDAAVPKPNDDQAEDPPGTLTYPWKPRPDPFSTYRAGFEVRTSRLCQRVLMFHHFAAELGTPDCLVRSTDFAYSHQQDPKNVRNPVYTFLREVTQSGYKRNNGEYLKRNLPPVAFTYSQPIVQDTVQEVDAESLENLPIGVDGAAYQWTDLHGEGIPGILSEQAGAWFYKRNISPISERPVAFAPLERVAVKPNLALAAGAQFMDLAGDGRPDLVVLDGPMPGFYEHDGDEGWQHFRPFSSRLNRDMRDPNLKFVDIDGDGHADVLITEDDALVWHASLAEQGFGPARHVYRALDEEHGPRLVFADGTQSIYLADLSGDGLIDLVRIRNDEICFWPNLGYGRFGAKVSMDHAPHFDHPDQFDHKRIRLADIDGSGTTDLIYLHRDGVRLYFNQSGNGWSAPQVLNIFPRVDDLLSIVPTDLLGNGTACLVWSSPLPGDAGRPMRYVNLMGGQKPHLLIKTVNNLGAETEVAYAPSTKFYLADKYAGTPWITKLPFPVHVVEKVTVIDTWRKTRFVSSYSYHYGYFDGVEREFRGFGRVEQVDVESFGKFAAGNVASPYITADKTLYQPPVKTIIWYHTGAALDRQRILTQFQAEYFPTSLAALPGYSALLAGFAEKRLPEPDLESQGLSADEWREALRSCKGMPLRQEIYELDVDQLEVGKQIPVRLFSTATHNCHIRCIQPQGDNQHAVFLAIESEALSYHYELDLRSVTLPADPGPIAPLEPDPRVAHTLNLSFDEYGNIQQSIAVGYKRAKLFADSDLTEHRGLIRAVQGELHLAYTETHYTGDVIESAAGTAIIQHYRLRVPWEVQTYELSGFTLPPGTFFDLSEFRGYRLSDTLLNQGSKQVGELKYHELPTPNTIEKRLVEHARTLFFVDDQTDALNFLKNPLAFGKLGKLGMPYEQYKLALTEQLLSAVFTNGQLNAVVRSDGAAPQTVLDTLNKWQTSGYLSGTDATDKFGPEAAGQYWMRSGTAGFEPDAALHFYLPEKYTDPFGNITTLKYDSRDLFVQSSTDMLGNTSDILRFDYRVLAPSKLKDINGNESEAYFDVLGMVVAMALNGKGAQGDSLSGFDADLANPPLAERIDFFFNATTYDESTSHRWLGNATARHVYYFGETLDETGNIVWGTHPARACGILRETHVAQLQPATTTTPAEETALQVAFECSDGHGAVLMKKVQAEPAPGATELRWLASGKTILNNKGKPVKQFEPYFSTNGHRCEAPLEEGVTPILYYDAAGRLARTELPDGTLSRVEFSPWHVKTFDQNDTVLESRWCRERLTATERGMPLYQPEDSPQARVEAATAEALAQNASVQDKRAATLSLVHANTPALTILDSLGREVISIAHNKYTDSTGTSHNEKYLTFTKLDAEGKPLWIRDARGNLVMQYITPAKANNDPSDLMLAGAVPCYDIAGNLLFQHSMDAGDRWILNDAAGKPMFAWDFNIRNLDNGAPSPEHRLFHTRYDALHRPVEQWITINTDPRALIEAFEYIDTDSFKSAAGVVDQVALAAAQKRNLIGQATHHYDSSGLASVERVDFKGAAEEITRTLVKDVEAPIMDWNRADRATLLEPEMFIQITEHDALGRMTTLYNWHRDIDGQPGHSSRVAVYVPKYNQRGVLESETLHVRAAKQPGLDGRAIFEPHADANKNIQAIKSITYNAKGQKTSLSLGNGSVTRYTYDPDTLRLVQLYTRRDARFASDCAADPDAARPARPCGVQNLHYTYDPVGNISHIQDDAQQTIWFANQQVEPSNDYSYDALYRLIEATGRENAAAVGAPPHPAGNWPTGAFPSAANTRNYTQRYSYDAVGNIKQMQHIATNFPGQPDGSWTRDYAYAFEDAEQPASNRLWQTWLGGDRTRAVTTYRYDPHGSMLNLSNTAPAQDIRWDWRDMIRALDLQGGGDAFYNYGSDKQRTRKRLKRNGNGSEDRIYLGGYELYRRRNSVGDVLEEIESLHLFEGEQRVLLVDDVLKTDRTHADGRPFKTDPISRYQYSNHLGSACMELDESAQVISYEEYHPYGTSAYRLMNSALEAPAKRYRYTGMEHDEESGLSYHLARYYVPWLARWVSADPVEKINLYVYAQNNPLFFLDKDGNDEEPSWYQHLSPEALAQVREVDRKSHFFEEHGYWEDSPWYVKAKATTGEFYSRTKEKVKSKDEQLKAIVINKSGDTLNKLQGIQDVQQKKFNDLKIRLEFKESTRATGEGLGEMGYEGIKESTFQVAMMPVNASVTKIGSFAFRMVLTSLEKIPLSSSLKGMIARVGNAVREMEKKKGGKIIEAKVTSEIVILTKTGTLTDAEIIAKELVGFDRNFIGYVSTFPKTRGLTVGFQSADHRRRLRYDFDPAKGPHLNVDVDGKSYAIPFRGSEADIQRTQKHLTDKY